MKLLAFVAVAAAATLHPRAPAAPTTVLVVSVSAFGTGAFIERAQVRLSSVGRVVLTAWDGDATFTALSRGKYHIQVRAIGYAPGDVDVFVTGDSLGVLFQLERLSTTLDTVRVVSKQVPRGLKEFEDRRRKGIGRYFTDSALFEHRGQGLQLFLATAAPGLMVRDRTVVTGGGVRGDTCTVLFYLDGFQLNSSGTAFSREPMNLDAMRLEDLAGIEVYSRAAAPVQYRPVGDYCKVILLWTKWPGGD